MQAAGVDPKAGGDTSDLAICQDVAYRITQREYGNAAAVFAVVEELLTDEDNYDFVISFLEDVQNLVSHHLSTLCAPEDITPWLGQRCTVCWATLARFWDSVSAWCSQTGVTLEPSDELLSVQNEKLRALLWTANRTLQAGAIVGPAQAVLYENGRVWETSAQRAAGRGRTDSSRGRQFGEQAMRFPRRRPPPPSRLPSSLPGQ